MSNRNRKKELQAAAEQTTHEEEVGAAPYGVDDIVVARESDAADKLLMTNMVHQTLTAHMEKLPALKALIDVGLEPMEDPAKWNARVAVGQKSTTVTFAHEGTICVYHMGSAAVVNDETGDNEFAKLIVQLINDYRPRRLRLAGFNRLVRSKAVANKIESALKANRVEVIAAGFEIRVWEPAGQLMWDLLAMFAAMKRDEILRRTVFGKASGARQNKNPFGDKRVPFGYVADGETLRPDPALRQLVCEVLSILADPSLSNRQMTNKVGALGITTDMIRNIHGEEATVSDLRHPRDFRASMEKYLDLYETGTYTMRYTVALDDVREIAGLPVLGKGSDRHIALDYTWGLPEGGWAPPEVFEQIRSRGDDDDAFTNQSHGRRKPFSNRPAWHDDKGELSLSCNAGDGYVLQRVVTLKHPVVSYGANGPAPQTMDLPVSRQPLARFTGPEFHQAVAEGIIDALSNAEGIPGVLVPDAKVDGLGRITKSLEQRKAAIRNQLADARKQQENAARHAARVEHAEEFLRLHDLYAARAKALEAELERDGKESDVSDASEATAQSVDVGTLIRALSILSRTGSQADDVLARTLRTVVPEFMVLQNADGSCQFSATVLIPSEEGVLQLGPIIGDLPIRNTTRKYKGRYVGTEKYEDLVIEEFGAGTDMAVIARQVGLSSPHEVTCCVADQLVDLGLSRQSAISLRAALIPELRAAMTRGLLQLAADGTSLHQPTLGHLVEMFNRIELPDGCTAEWAAYCLNVYRTNVVDMSRKPWSGSTAERQAVIDLVVAAGGTMTVADLEAALGWKHTRNSLVGIRTTALNARADLIPAGTWHVDNSTNHVDGHCEVATVPCPHCAGHATVVVAALEVTRQLLCPLCRRMPVYDSPQFPEAYLHLPPIGPRGIDVSWYRRKFDDYPGVVSARNTTRQDVDAATKAEAVRRYQAGDRVLQLCAELGITTTVLYDALAEAGVPNRQPYRRRLPD